MHQKKWEIGDLHRIAEQHEQLTRNVLGGGRGGGGGLLYRSGSMRTLTCKQQGPVNLTMRINFIPAAVAARRSSSLLSPYTITCTPHCIFTHTDSVNNDFNPYTPH